MKSPTYDWEWFKAHTPFKTILEKWCELEIEKEYIPYRVFGSIWSKRTHFHINVNYPKFEQNFIDIKNKLLQTRVCKNNHEIYEWVKSLECTKRALGTLILDGCLVYDSASLSWNYKDK